MTIHELIWRGVLLVMGVVLCVGSLFFYIDTIRKFGFELFDIVIFVVVLFLMLIGVGAVATAVLGP